MSVATAGPVAGAAPAGVPRVGRPRPMRVPPVAERTLASGLRVISARRRGIPRFEVRLRVPSVRHGRADDGARQLVLAETLLSGTPSLSSVDIAEAAQRLGGMLSASADAEWIGVGGSALSVSLAPFLRLLGQVVREADFPPDEVALQRERVAQEILLSLSQPETIARDALLGRLYGSHPYGRGTPTVAAVERVRPAALRQAHAARLLPPGSVLVLVGDMITGRALDAAEAAFDGWGGGAGREGAAWGREGAARDRLPAPPAPARGPTLIVDRPGAVQSNIRLGGTAVPRSHPDFPALVLANAVYGGYFTSRLVANIRERRGYTYSPGSGLDHRQVASLFSVQADVGTDVTAAALNEIRYELGRMTSTLPDQEELDAARRYLQGTLAMSIQTQAGLTSYLATLASFGLGVDYLREYPRLLERVSREAVRATSERYLAPAGLSTVLVGDAAAIRASVEALDDVEVRTAS